jgi:hypothetical protein
MNCPPLVVPHGHRRGADFDLLGIYAAKALSVPKEPLNVFLRVRRWF